MPEISIVETREIIRKLKHIFLYDFSNYAFTAFRFKLDRTIKRHYLKYSDVLISRLVEDKDFFDEFLYDISVPSTEMFRDPELWTTIKESLLPEISGEIPCNVWFPDIVSGNELFSFLVLLTKTKMQNSFNIKATSLSRKSLEHIRAGEFDNKVLEQSMENYCMVFPDSDLKNYLSCSKEKYYRNNNLFSNVSFSLNDLNLQNAPEGAEIIFFRNKLLNYSKEFQDFLLDYFVEILKPGGYLIFGYQEEVEKHLFGTQKVQAFNMEERIFIKRGK